MTILAKDAINPLAMQIGSLIGLLKKDGDSYSLDQEWFRDPWGHLNNIPSKPELLELLGTLLTSAEGNALGTPREAMDRTWYPILSPAAAGEEPKPTGLYLVTGKSVDGQPTELGLGALHNWDYKTFNILPYAYFPVIVLPKDTADTFHFILGEGAHPVEIGMDINGPDGFFSTGSGSSKLSYDGFKAGSQIFFDGTNPSLDLSFINLQLPGEKEGSNRSLQDLINDVSVKESITLALAVLGGQLKQHKGAAATAGEMIKSIMELLGLSGPIPGIDWESLVNDPSKVAEIFTQWLQNIAGNSTLLKTWLNDWFCLFNGKDPASTIDSITGSGTRQDPFAANLLTLQISENPVVDINIGLTIATEKTAERVLNIYPGFRVATSPVCPIEGVEHFGVELRAEAELLCYGIQPANSNTAHSVTLFPQYSLLAVAANTNKAKPVISVGDAFPANPEENEAGFSIDTISVGFTFNGETDGGGIPSPNFRFNGVQTSIGSWPQIDLSNFNKETIEKAIGPVINAAITKFFGEENTYAQALTTVLGISKPTAYQGEWPLQDQLLLSPSQLGLLVNNPFAAIGAYYTRAIEAEDEDGLLFRYLVPAFSALLGSDDTEVSGEGTVEAPWTVKILQVGDAALNLALARPADGELAIAFDFVVPLPIERVAASFNLNAAMMVLQLPGTNGSGSWNAAWMQALTAKLLVKDKEGKQLLTPDVGGVFVGANAVYVEGGWKNTEDFFVKAVIEKMMLKSSAGKPIEFGNLEVGSKAWDVDQLKAFTPAIINGLGLLMLENGGKMGVTLAAMLGTLPNLDKVLDGKKHKEYNFPSPKGLIIPEGWPQLEITDYANPWNDLVRQLRALYSDAKYMDPLMRLIGWALTDEVPKKSGAKGTLADPWLVNLPKAYNIDLLTWKQDNQSGYGVQRKFAVNAAEGVELTTLIRADVPGFMLDDTTLSTNNFPGLSLINLIQNPEAGKPLVDVGGLTIGKVQIGAIVQLQDGKLQFMPVLRFLNSRYKAKEKLRTIEIIAVDGKPQFKSNDKADVLNALINGLMGKLSEAARQKDFTQLKAFLEILTLYKLLDKVVGEDKKATYSFNPGAWSSVLANPYAYFNRQTKKILANNGRCEKLVKLLAMLLGYSNFKLPAPWQGVQFLLKALGLVNENSKFFMPQFDNVLEFVSDPVAYLQSTVSELFGNMDEIKALVSSLAGIAKPKVGRGLNPGDYFSVDSSGSIITVKIPTEKIIKVGEEVQLFASMVIDVKSYTLNNTIAIGSRTLESSLGFTYAPAYTDGALSHAYGFTLAGLPGAPPAFEPLPIWPFPADTDAYIKRLGTEIPVTLLSSMAVKYINEYIVPANPAVINIFKVLGLTTPGDEAEEETPQVRPLTGIILHPMDWLLSGDALGDDKGDLNLLKLGKLLNAVTGAAGIKHGDIELKPYQEDGVILTGLPWGAKFAATANTADGAKLTGWFEPKLPAKAPTIALKAGLSFGAGSGVGIDGKAELGYALSGENSLGITANYEKDAFTLTAKANKTDLALLPFGGLNQFIEGDTGVMLLKMIGTKLFDAYNAYIKKANDIAGIKDFVERMKELTEIRDGQQLYDFFKAIYDDPLGQFSDEKITKVIPKMHEFVDSILKLKGFSMVSENKMLQYKHTFAAFPNAKVLINLGLRKAGDATIFGMWLEPVASYQWISLGLSNTGVGVVLPIDKDNVKIQYEVNVALGANFTELKIPNAPKPTLIFGLTGDETGLLSHQLNFFPVANSKEAGTLEIALLPDVKLIIAGRGDVSLQDWMIKFGVEFLVPFIANAALATEAVSSWLDKTTIGGVEGVPGKILTSWGLLNHKEDNYSLNKLSEAFDINKPGEIVAKLLFAALDLLKGQRIVAIGSDGDGIYIERLDESDDIKRYGIRVQITDIDVSGREDADGNKLTLQLGKYYDGDTELQNWTKHEGQPGLAAYFISKDKEGVISLEPKFELVSVGLDFAGANAKKPLINAGGVTLLGVEPRVYVSLDKKQGSTNSFGAAMMLHSLGIPLGPGFGNKDAKNGNPVAQNLLSSGGSGDKVDAINPAFSVAASYVLDKGFELQLFDAKGKPTNKIWIPVMRALGPLQARKVGIGWQPDDNQPKLDFLFDGEVSLAGLSVDLVDLDIGIPIKNPGDYDGYSLDLAGLDISYNAGAVAISGGFLKDDNGSAIQYTGQALIQTSAWAIGGFGSYALIESQPSLFIFAFLNAPLGGPPCFFVKGLAGGFGYNRTINIPPASEIERFPFISGIDNPADLGGKDGKAPTNEDALRKLGTTVVPPKLGIHWAAAGVNFASFEVVFSKAVMMVIFGDDFEVALVGVSNLTLPKPAAGNPLPTKYVDAKMGFKVTYKASTGVLAMDAVLSSNSYVMDPSCKLTGGMAFYVWFKDLSPDIKAGDFVFTLGGYHPRFAKPAHYPTVPRLGFSWAMSNVSIKGGAYFALTPTAVMAGGSLEAIYQSGNLRAWFTAYADFLIMWKPFYYDIAIGVSVGASYTVEFIWTTTYTVELGADVHIWGPDMTGTATVNWWIISFTVNFGKGASQGSSATIDWNDFVPYFLPGDKAQAAPPQQKPGDKLVAGNDGLLTAPLPVQQVTQVKATGGLLRELPNTDAVIGSKSPVLWQVNPAGLSISVDTVVPLTKVTIIAGRDGERHTIENHEAFGIRPLGTLVMGQDGADSTLTVNFLYNGANADLSKWEFTSSVNGMPESLWSPKAAGSDDMKAKIIPGLMVGFSAKAVAKAGSEPTDGPPKFWLSNLGYSAYKLRDLPLPNAQALTPAAAAEVSPEALKKVEETVMGDSVVTKRNNILNALISAGLNIETDGTLDQMAAFATQTFQSAPMLGELSSWGLGTTQAKAAATQPVVFITTAFVAETESAYTPQPAKLRAVLLQYARPQLATDTFMAATEGEEKKVYSTKTSLFAGDMQEAWMADAITGGKMFKKADGSNALPAVEVHPGTSVIYDMDPKAAAPSLKIKGKVPVFAAWFNQYHQLMDSKILTAGQALPKGVAELIMSGASAATLAMPHAYGWHTSSELTLVNPNALIGTGAIIIPDNPTRIKVKRTSNAFGLISGAEVVRKNLVNSGGVLKAAGIETVMPLGLQTVALLVKNTADVNDNGSDVEVRAKIIKGGKVEYVGLKAATVIRGRVETAFLYVVPATEGNHTVVHAKPKTGHSIAGVLGLTGDTAAVKKNWQKVVLQPQTASQLAATEATVITIEQPLF